MSEELKAAAIKAANRMRDNHKEVCRVMMPHADEPKLWEESTDRANVMARYIFSPPAPGPGFDAGGFVRKCMRIGETAETEEQGRRSLSRLVAELRTAMGTPTPTNKETE